MPMIPTTKPIVDWDEQLLELSGSVDERVY